MDSRLTRDVFPANVRVYPGVEALSRAVAASLAEVITSTVARGTACSLALAGGNTPRALYQVLAADYRVRIPWARVHVFWGDERYVPPDDPSSNYRMAREALLDHVPVPPHHVHPMPTQFPVPDDAARTYEETLRAHFPGPWPRFDLILLGLGVDGHTASLFPGSSAVEECERWVVAARAPVEPSQRLTLTFPVLNHAANIWFLATGAEKAAAVHRTIRNVPEPAQCPAAGVRPDDGAVVWWVDNAAAELLGT